MDDVSVGILIFNELYLALGGFGIQWENGLGGLGGYERIFWGACAWNPSKNQKKNPFVSARSAQSVLPLYHKTTQR
jgi:hypothetical protein